MQTEHAKSFTAKDRADLVIRFLHPKLAAEKLGLTLPAVMKRRAELGLPAVEEQFRKWGDKPSNGSAKRRPR